MVKKAVKGMMKEERVGRPEEHPETGGMVCFISSCAI
jgi:hypothetical protein